MSNEITSLITTRVSRRTVLRGAALTGAAAALPLAFRRVSAQEPLTIAFSVPGLNFPFFVHMMNLAEAHAAALGGIEFIRLDGQEGGAPSSAKQSADLEAVVAQGVDGIVISPNDAAALAPAIQAAIDAGVPVVTVDRNVTGAATLAHVGADNVEGGRAQGRYLIELLPDGGEVIELQGQPGATPAIDRHAGFDEIMRGQEAIVVVASQTANFARAQAATVMESLLAAHPNPAAVVCANDDMAFGAIEALKDAGLAIPVIGFDALPEALIAIRDGDMAATIEQFPGGQAQGAIDLLVAKLRDGQDPAEHTNFLTPIIISAENLAEAERAAEAGIVPPATPAAGGAVTVAVRMLDIKFDPTEIRVPANTEVTVQLVNEGVALHDFLIDALGVNSGEYIAGQTGAVTFNSGAPGEHEFYCAVPGHREAGMVGKLIVE